jgi:phosphoserine phosphatase RsbU/P
MEGAEQKKLILLVDDTPTNLQIVQSILKSEYKLRISTSGAKALELARVEPRPDLILLDVMMPEMDGYEVCARLKADPSTRDIPVIFLTGKTGEEDEARGLDIGAVDYIRKPFSPAIVRARVKLHLALRDSRDELAARLLAINEEMETARQIQLSILPQCLPAVEGLEIAAHFLPMTSVSGDFYDFIVLNRKQLGVLIADVSGHGPAAALITSMIRIALSQQLAHASDPALVLAGLNRALCGNCENHFVTAAYVFIDVEEKFLRYAGAAHPPLVVWSKADQCARVIDENGLPLGLFPDEKYTAVQVPFVAGDRCVLYTDGVPEAKNPAGEEFATARFLGVLEMHGISRASEFSEALLDHVFQWSGHPRGHGQRDDITLLAIDFEDQ